jgi:hypothetical protein
MSPPNVRSDSSGKQIMLDKRFPCYLPWILGRPLLLFLCFLSPSTEKSTTTNTFAAPAPAPAAVGTRSTESPACAVPTTVTSERKWIRGEFRRMRPRWRGCSRHRERWRCSPT